METKRQRPLLAMRRALPWALALAAAPVALVAAAEELELSSVLDPQPGPAAPPLPSLAELPIQLAIDDNISDGQSGFNGAAAAQFLWFNRFSPAVPDFDLTEVWVLFEPGDNLAVGAAIEIVIYRDADGDPSNGATLLASSDRTIDILDGSTFSIYPFDPPLEFRGGGDVLVGVIDRFVTSGVTPPTFPASIDTTTSAGRSWFAAWSGDPPAGPGEPTLPTDNVMLPVNGNWMIRAFGVSTSAIDIPSLSGAGPIFLAMALAFAGWISLRRRCC